jgi:multiple sugar transport system permease protein
MARQEREARRARIVRWLDSNIKLIFLLPSVIFVVVMIIFPLGYNLALSFADWSMSSVEPPRFVGLQNYVDLLMSSRFQLSVVRTLAYSGGSLVVEMILGVALALFLNRQFRGKAVVKSALLLPMVMTPVAVGMIWLLIFEPTIGLANYVLKSLSLPKLLWLGSRKTALASLMLVDVWEWTPVIAVITLAGLSALPTEPFESAKVDGANAWQTLWRVTLPMVSSTIVVAMMLRLIDVLKTFDQIYTTTQGGPGFATENTNILGYLQAFQYFRFGSAAAILVMFFLLIIGATMILLFVKNRMRNEQ